MKVSGEVQLKKEAYDKYMTPLLVYVREKVLAVFYVLYKPLLITASVIVSMTGLMSREWFTHMSKTTTHSTHATSVHCKQEIQLFEHDDFNHHIDTLTASRLTMTSN